MSGELKTSFVCVFDLRFYVPFNSYGHVEMVSSPNYTFSLASELKTEQDSLA